MIVAVLTQVCRSLQADNSGQTALNTRLRVPSQQSDTTDDTMAFERLHALGVTNGTTFADFAW